MKLLINTSTLSSTGVVQVALSFINECRKYRDNTYIVALSETMHFQMDVESFPNNFKFYIIEKQPRYLINGIKSRKKLKKIEKDSKADCVFSVFGPSYWTPKKPHLMGYAFGHYVYPDSPFFKKISFYSFIKVILYKNIHRYFFRKNGNYFVSETDDVSVRAIKYLGCNPNNMYTVSNTYSKYFDKFVSLTKNTVLPPKKDNEFRFLNLVSFAPHKNLEILNEVIPILKKQNLFNIKFILTIDNKIFEAKFNLDTKKFIINIGQIEAALCPQLYSECDALFNPTLIECFTANYPEAMKMRLPILTSNLSFATNICSDAALYFDPLNPNDIVEKIKEIIAKPNLYQKLIFNGQKRLDYFSTSEKRARKYLEICKKISNIEKND